MYIYIYIYVYKYIYIYIYIYIICIYIYYICIYIIYICILYICKCKAYISSHSKGPEQDHLRNPLRSVRPEHRGTFHTQFWFATIFIYIYIYICVCVSMHVYNCICACKYEVKMFMELWNFPEPGLRLEAFGICNQTRYNTALGTQSEGPLLPSRVKDVRRVLELSGRPRHHQHHRHHGRRQLHLHARLGSQKGCAHHLSDSLQSILPLESVNGLNWCVDFLIAQTGLIRSYSILFWSKMPKLDLIYINPHKHSQPHRYSYYGINRQLQELHN